MNPGLKQPLRITGVALVLAAGLWHFQLGRRWTQRLPRGWNTTASYLGTQTYPDTGTGRLPERDEISDYERSSRVVSDSGRPRSVTFEDRLVIRNISTGKVLWEYTSQALVDPRTGEHLAEPYRGDVVVFPRGVRRGSYRLRTNYLKGIPLAFERVESLDGLETYVFSYRGRGEYTESYAGTAEYEGVRAQPGQEIKCADDQFFYRVWVEPRTGEQVKLEEGCPSGDYIYDIATSRQLGPVDRWGGVTAGDALIEAIAEVRHRRTKYLWSSRYLPASLATAGLIALVLGMQGRGRPAAA